MEKGDRMEEIQENAENLKLVGNSIDGLDKLPMELWSKVVVYLREPQELAKLELVSRRFRSLLIDNCWTQIGQVTLKDDAYSSKGSFLISLGDTFRFKFPSPYPQHQVFPLLTKLSNLNFISIDFLKEDVELLGYLGSEKVEKARMSISSSASLNQVPEFIRKASKNLKELSIVFSLSDSSQIPDLHKSITLCSQLDLLHYNVSLSAKDGAGFVGDVFSPILISRSLVNLKKLSLVLTIDQKGLESLSDAILNCGAHLEVLDIELCGGGDEIQLLNFCSQKAKQLEAHSLQTLKELTTNQVHFDEEPLAVDVLTTCPQLEECELPQMNRYDIYYRVPAYIEAVLSTGSQQLKIFSGLTWMGEYDEDDFDDDVLAVDWKRLADLVRAKVPGVNVTRSEEKAVFQLNGAWVELTIPDPEESDDDIDSDEMY